MKFEFTIEEINVIMSGIVRLPYEQVFQLIENIKAQAAPQLKSSEPDAKEQFTERFD